MSSTIHPRIQLKRDTTENWNNAIGFIPLPGEVIIYEDYDTKTYEVEEYGETVTKTVNIPNIKIGTGNAYVQDLAFVNESTSIPEVVQSDWEEDDTTSLAHVLNRPAIRAGEGENSVVVGNIDQEEATGITIYLTGEEGALTYSYTPPRAITSVSLSYCIVKYNDNYYTISALSSTNATITFDITLGALSNAEAICFPKGVSGVVCGQYAYLEGNARLSSGMASHVEGSNTYSTGKTSHAEGLGTRALKDATHSEGRYTMASGVGSHAEGYKAKANGAYSHSEGYYTIANGNHQHVQGKYNIEDNANTYADIVGNGTSQSARSNAYTLDWSGNGWYAGKLTVGTGPTNDMDVVTKQYMENKGYLTLADLPIYDGTVV